MGVEKRDIIPAKANAIIYIYIHTHTWENHLFIVYILIEAKSKNPTNRQLTCLVGVEGGGPESIQFHMAGGVWGLPFMLLCYDI